MKKNKGAKVYTVLFGDLEDCSENVQVLGVFLSEGDAFKFRNADYKESSDIDDDEEDFGPDLNSVYVDNGHHFWSITESTLQ